MSTFTNWNGPGDCAGDLTIFYQRLLELRRIIEGFEADHVKILAELNGKYNTAQGASSDAEKAVRDAIAEMKKLQDEMKAMFTNFKLDAQGAIASLKEMTIPSLTGLTYIGDSAGVHILEFMKGWVMAAETWVFTASKTFFNSPKIYDHIAWKMHNPTRNVTDKDTPPVPMRDKLFNAMCPIGAEGHYILAIIDSDTDTLDNNDFGTGHIYFTVKDTTTAAAVLNVATAQEQGSIWHGALSATYVYRNAGNGPASPNDYNGIEFAIWKLTNASGKVSLYVTARVIGIVAPPVGYCWFTGRGLRRPNGPENFSPDPRNLVEYIRTEPFIGRGMCHGNAITGLITDDFFVQESIQMKQGASFELEGEILIEDDKMDVYDDSTFHGDVDIKGKSNISGSAKIDGDINTAGSIVAKGDIEADNAHIRNNTNTDTLDVETNTTIGEDLSVGGVSYFGDEVTMHNQATIDGDLTVGGNTTLKGHLDVFENAYFARSLEAQFEVTSDKLKVYDSAQLEQMTDVNGNVWLDTKDTSKTVIGTSGKPVHLITDEYIYAEIGLAGRVERMAYLSDVTSGLQFQDKVTAFMEFEPTSATTEIPLPNGEKKVFAIGDTIMVKPSVLGDKLDVPSIYRCTDIVADFPTWDKIPDLVAPSLNLTGIYWSWQWLSLVYDEEREYWRWGYVLWNPNHNQSEAWSVVFLDLDGFRHIYDQDEIDHYLAYFASIQPDWLDDEPVLELKDQPASIPNLVPNPAFINNKPWLGITTMAGGDWDAQDLRYDTIVRGGDFDQLAEDIKGSMQQTDRATSQQIKNGIVQISHGLDASMPHGSPNTAYSLKFTTDLHELWIDLGDPTATFGNAVCKDGNMLLLAAPKKQPVADVWIVPVAGLNPVEWKPDTEFNVHFQDVNLIDGTYNVTVGTIDLVVDIVDGEGETDRPFTLAEGHHSLVTRIDNKTVGVIDVDINPATIYPVVSRLRLIPSDTLHNVFTKYTLEMFNVNVEGYKTVTITIGGVTLTDQVDFVKPVGETFSKATFPSQFSMVNHGKHMVEVNIGGFDVGTLDIDTIEITADLTLVPDTNIDTHTVVSLNVDNAYLIDGTYTFQSSFNDGPRDDHAFDVINGSGGYTSQFPEGDHNLKIFFLDELVFEYDFHVERFELVYPTNQEVVDAYDTMRAVINMSQSQEHRVVYGDTLGLIGAQYYTPIFNEIGLRQDAVIGTEALPSLGLPPGLSTYPLILAATDADQIDITNPDLISLNRKLTIPNWDLLFEMDATASDRIAAFEDLYDVMSAFERKQGRPENADKLMKFKDDLPEIIRRMGLR